MDDKERKDKERKIKVLKVALYLAEQAEQAHTLGRQYEVEDEQTAHIVAEALTMFVSCTNPDEVKAIVKASKLASEEAGFPTYWTYLCLNANWLSWAWHEQGDDELAEAWSNAWYELNKYSLENLKGDELKEYVRLTD